MKKEIIVCDECGNPIPGETGKIYDGVTKGYAGKLTVMLNTTEPYEDYLNHFCCRQHLVNWLFQKSMEGRFGVTVDIREHSMQQERIEPPNEEGSEG